MTEKEKKTRDFIVTQLKKREMTETELDKLTEVLYPHDGSNKGMVEASRQFSKDFGDWQQAPQTTEKDTPVTPMSDAEIEALAAII